MAAAPAALPVETLHLQATEIRSHAGNEEPGPVESSDFRHQQRVRFAKLAMTSCSSSIRPMNRAGRASQKPLDRLAPMVETAADCGAAAFEGNAAITDNRP